MTTAPPAPHPLPTDPEVLAYIARATKVETVDGERTKIATESALIWCFDPDGEITFDEENVRHLHADENPMVEALLDRPLLGVPCSAERMYARMGLCSSASLDLTDRGGCMVAQIVETVKYMKEVINNHQDLLAWRKFFLLLFFFRCFKLVTFLPCHCTNYIYIPIVIVQ